MATRFVPSGVSEPALHGSARDFQSPKGPSLLGRCEDFYAWQDTRRRGGTWPFSRSTESGSGTSCSVRDDSGHLVYGVNFASQDYLSLSTHPEIKRAAHDALNIIGAHSAGSAAFVGNTSTSVELECRIGEFLGVNEAILFPTGWAAGFGVIKGLIRSNDHVLMDALAHSCLQTGALAATKNVTLHRHLNIDDCRRKLAAIRSADPKAGIMVVTESLFSMDSDTPDIAAMQALAHEFDATLMVDVAHDLGNLGPAGTGHIGAQGMLGDVDLVMGSFSKTFSSNGGFVATKSRAVKEYLRFYSPPCTFSNALSPVQVAVVTKALEIVRSAEGQRLRDKLMANVIGLRHELSRRGLASYGDPSAIVAVKAGNEAHARLTARELPKLGLLANLVEYPAVARGKARFRMQVMAAHTRSEVETAASCMDAGMTIASSSAHGAGLDAIPASTRT